MMHAIQWNTWEVFEEILEELLLSPIKNLKRTVISEFHRSFHDIEVNLPTSLQRTFEVSHPPPYCFIRLERVWVLLLPDPTRLLRESLVDFL